MMLSMNIIIIPFRLPFSSYIHLLKVSISEIGWAVGMVIISLVGYPLED